MIQLRRAVLAAAVVDGTDLLVDPAGGDDPDSPAVLTGRVRLTWRDVAAALDGWQGDPEHPVARCRLAALADGARALLGPGGSAAALRAHVEPVGSPLHPGAGWAVGRLAGGAADAGWGVHVGGPTGTVRPLPTSLRAHVAGGSPRREAALWRAATARTEHLGGLLVERVRRDDAERRPVVLRPVAEADVVTLLLSEALRAWVAGRDGSGLGTLAAPTRTRGWVDLRRVDPDFVVAAHAATGEIDRGFARPVLVGAEEIALPRVAPGRVSGR